MVYPAIRSLMVAVCLVCASCAEDGAPTIPASPAKAPADDAPAPVIDRDDASTDRAVSARNSPAVDGLWVGSWGGGESDGVVFQPVIAEMFVDGRQVELHGFRAVGNVTGTFRLDLDAGKLQVFPNAETADQPAPDAIEFTCEIKGDQLSLIDSDNVEIALRRRHIQSNPMANGQLEFVAASEINDAGDLIVTEFTMLKAGRAGKIFFEPHARTLKTDRAVVYQTQETGLKQVSLDEARELLRESMPVAVAYRPDDRPAAPQLHELWTELGAPSPDSDAFKQTISQLLRPGILVFVLSAEADAVPPP